MKVYLVYSTSIDCTCLEEAFSTEKLATTYAKKCNDEYGFDPREDDEYFYVSALTVHEKIEED